MTPVVNPLDRSSEDDRYKYEGSGDGPGSTPSPRGCRAEYSEPDEEASEIGTKRRDTVIADHLQAETVCGLFGRDPEFKPKTGEQHRRQGYDDTTESSD